jgi:hypothetical protein
VSTPAGAGRELLEVSCGVNGRRQRLQDIMDVIQHGQSDKVPGDLQAL